MTITGPNRKYSTAPDNYSEFVIINNFVFRPKQVEGFYRQEAADGLRTTMVIFPPYKQTVPDPEWRLYNFLLKRKQPLDLKDLLPTEETL